MTPHNMKEDKTPVKTTAGKENQPVTESTSKKKAKEEKPPTKVVVRRLPPSMTEDQFKVQVSPIPDYDYFYFVPADMSLMPNAFSRAYINFIDQNDLFIFTQKFDGYVFVDSKGGEFPAVVEFAPFQRIPKNRPNRKKDSKVGTIEADPVYIAFKERMEAENLENKTAVNASKQHFFETSLALDKKEEVSNTPLLEYIKNKRAERQRIRDEKREEKRKKDLERKRAKEEQRRVKKEDESSVVKVLSNSQTANKERLKEKDVKPSFVKKKPDEGKTAIKEKVSVETRTKESRRTGKSYLEERQRLAERREEQRKKLSQGQSNSATRKSPLTIDESGNTTVTVGEEKPAEDASVAVTGSKSNETELKKPERVFKREERRSSYKYDKYDKYESKRDRDDDSRRSRRGNERSYQNSKREEERSEDGGRKRYSDSRRGHDTSTRDRYKDKEKNKGYSQKKSESFTDIDKKIKYNKESSDKTISSNEKTGVKNTELPEENKQENSSLHKSDFHIDSSENMDRETKPKTFDPTKPARRKSVDYDKARSSMSYTKSYGKEKYSEKKRRNSMGSNKNTSENKETVSVQNEKDQHVTKDNTTENELPGEEKCFPEQEANTCETDIKSVKKGEIRKEFEDHQREIPKRRNSTGGQESEKMSPRRNSLGSEDKNEVSFFKEHKVEGETISKEGKSRRGNKGRQNSRDPRTERRIRNKDRPSQEIYRPGMGRFSKQRLEREKEKEKGFGSSTEMDSPSPSPSPTPQLRHKSTTPH